MRIRHQELSDIHEYRAIEDLEPTVSSEKGPEKQEEMAEQSSMGFRESSLSRNCFPEMLPEPIVGEDYVSDGQDNTVRNYLATDRNLKTGAQRHRQNVTTEIHNDELSDNDGEGFGMLQCFDLHCLKWFKSFAMLKQHIVKNHGGKLTPKLSPAYKYLGSKGTSENKVVDFFQCEMQGENEAWENICYKFYQYRKNIPYEIQMESNIDSEDIPPIDEKAAEKSLEDKIIYMTKLKMDICFEEKLIAETQEKIRKISEKIVNDNSLIQKMSPIQKIMEKVDPLSLGET